MHNLQTEKICFFCMCKERESEKNVLFVIKTTCKVRLTHSHTEAYKLTTMDRRVASVNKRLEEKDNNFNGQPNYFIMISLP